MKGCLGRAHDKIRMKSTGTSETKCFEKMMHAGADMGEWIEWLAPPHPLSEITSQPRSPKNTKKIGTPGAGIYLHFSG